MLHRTNNKYKIAYNLLRNYTTVPTPNLLKQTLENKISSKLEELKDLKRSHSNYKIGDITVGSLIGGMRGNSLMYWDGTTLSPTEGIKFKGLTIEQCQSKLPNGSIIDGENRSNRVFLPESMLWLLITGDIPTEEQTLSVINLLNSVLKEQNGKLPRETEIIMNKLPADMHPMTQLSIGITSLSKTSKFSSLYTSGKLGKTQYWSSIFDDSIKLIANLPLLAGKIYSNLQHDVTKPLGTINYHRDWAYNISSMLGMTPDSKNIKGLSSQQQSDFVELMRLYTGIHVDHEGGNVSAHSTHLVGSTLADPFLSYGSGINGLAGPLHGLAAQEVVRFLFNLQKKLETTTTAGSGSADHRGTAQQDDAISNQIWEMLSNGQVIPGYGHAVLRIFDPRFNAMLQFVKQRPNEFNDDKYVNLMQKLSVLVPQILKEHGKCKNPYPNVDAASGILFYHYGITELMFFTVIFGCSRAIGPLTQLIWDRILGLPIERPKSLDMETLKRMTTSQL